MREQCSEGEESRQEVERVFRNTKIRGMGGAPTAPPRGCRVWFNKAFSGTYNVIRLLQSESAPVPYDVICSHSNPEFVGFAASHACEVEPPLSGEAYVEYCLDFCLRHGVQAFVPGKERERIADHRARFEETGVKVLLACGGDTMRAFECKATFYAELDPAVALAPRFIKVQTAEEFLGACETLRGEGVKVCFKPGVSTGGLGFRVIDDSRSDLRNLLNGEPVRITSRLASAILSQEPSFRDLLVMEYMSGPEFSVDCLADDGRLMRAVGRRKAVRLGGAQLLELPPQVLAVCERLTAHYRLNAVFNIQIRMANGVPKLLEINPRMSGGIYFACLSGLNFPGWAIGLMMGLADPERMPTPRMGLRVQQQYHEFVFGEAEDEDAVA